jgi:hypothetical protein
MKIALIASLFVILSFESCNQGSNRFSKGLNDNDTISLIAQNTAQVSHAKVNPINLTTPNGDSIGIQKLLSKKNKIFLFITEHCCQECVHKEFKRLNKLVTSENNRNIIILMSYSYLREQYAFILFYELKCQVFSIFGKQLISQGTLLNLPLYFILDDSLQIRQPFYITNETSDKVIDNFVQNALTSNIY